MGKIVISTNVSLDGVVQDPDGEEGFRLGGWFGQFGGKDLEEWAKVEFEEALGTEALLLGRRSDEWFGPQGRRAGRPSGHRTARAFWKPCSGAGRRAPGAGRRASARALIPNVLATSSGGMRSSSIATIGRSRSATRSNNASTPSGCSSGTCWSPLTTRRITSAC